MQGNALFATDSQVCKRTSEGEPRKGKFHETPVTAGDTICSVKGLQGAQWVASVPLVRSMFQTHVGNLVVAYQ